MDPPPSFTNLSRSSNLTIKEKGSWDLKATEGFIIACLEQVSKGEQLGTSFTKNGWNGIAFVFKELTRNFFDKPKFKNKFDNLENPLYGKFMIKGLLFAHKLTKIFKDVVTNGEFQWASSFRILPIGVEVDMNDGYRLSLEGIGLYLEEDSGDSEDSSVGATNVFEGIHLNDSQGIVSQGISGQKSRENKKRINHTEKIIDVVGVIAEACKSHDEVVASASIHEVMNELKKLPKLQKYLLLYTQCCNMMMLKTTREMFIAMRGLDEQIVCWLRDAVKTPLLFKVTN
ncbi:hypothetical protein JHK85_000299 [Glycine max]|nr:hypothetical protein JHK85_000299 [Glycine max]